jgi:hypothetical protein
MYMCAMGIHLSVIYMHNPHIHYPSMDTITHIYITAQWIPIAHIYITARYGYPFIGNVYVCYGYPLGGNVYV